jgi:hypothetical protein
MKSDQRFFPGFRFDVLKDFFFVVDQKVTFLWAGMVTAGIVGSLLR